MSRISTSEELKVVEEVVSRPVVNQVVRGASPDSGEAKTEKQKNTHDDGGCCREAKKIKNKKSSELISGTQRVPNE